MSGEAEQLEGSTTKYLQDEVTDDNEANPPPTMVPKPELSDTSEATSAASQAKYIEVDPQLLGKEKQPKSKSPSASQKSDKSVAMGKVTAPVEYVKLKPAMKAAAGKPSKVRSEPARAVRSK